jgi:hypothetical protein
MIFPLVSVSRPALGPTQPPVQWLPGVISPAVKRGRGMTLTTHPHLVPRSWMSRSYTFFPPQAPPWRVAGLLYFTLLYFLIRLMQITERHGRVINTPVSYSVGPEFKSRHPDRFVVFLSPSKRISVLYLTISPQPLPSKSSPIHNSLHAVES